MSYKTISLFSIYVFALIGSTFFSVGPAVARDTCFYGATNGTDWAITTLATANKTSRACRRAKRRCNRKLRRAKRRHEISRGTVTPSCVRMRAN